MATFDEAQQAALVEITGMNANSLGDWLTFYASSITESAKTRVVADIALWELAKDAYVKTVGLEANFGAVIDPSADRANIRNRVRKALFIETIGSGMARTVRG